MLTEIRELEQDSIVNDEKPKKTGTTQDELQAILTSIPSFSDMNKK